MKKFFDMENPVMRALGTACDLLVLNLLTILCCLPVLTAGASFTAMFDVAIHAARGEESYIVKPFFRSFAGNLKKGTVLWLIFLAADALLILDYFAAASYAPVFRAGIAAMALLLLALGMFVFALLSRYENTVAATLKNAAVLAVGFFPRTLGMVVFAVALWVLGVRFYRVGAPVLLMFGLSLPAYVCALLMKGVFDKIDP